MHYLARQNSALQGSVGGKGSGMSARGIRREHARKRAKRAALATGSAVAATLAMAQAANANDYVVDTNGDGPADACDPGACTLRDALAASSSLSNDDTITFAPSVTGTIRLTAGALTHNANSGSVSIDGPGADVLTISGDADDSGTPNAGDSRIFDFTGSSGPSGSIRSISGLTLTEGYAAGGNGGAILDSVGSLTLDDVVITANSAGTGGGVSFSSPGRLEVIDSTVSGNDAMGSGGGIYAMGGTAGVAIDGSTITGNTSGSDGGGVYADSKYGAEITDSAIKGNEADGGGGVSNGGFLYVQDTEISGNKALTDSGGGLDSSGKYAGAQLQGVTISGNSAQSGAGGVAISTGDPKYADTAMGNQVIDSTISGNTTANGAGGGILVGELGPDDTFLLDRSTLSGNEAPFGGGINFQGRAQNTVRVQDSTISGNTAQNGGGVAIGQPTGATASPVAGSGSIDLYNSTVAANQASVAGGGVYLANFSPSSGVYTTPDVKLYSDILGDNTANGSPEDIFAENATTTGTGFQIGYSLLEDDGGSTYAESPTGSNVVSADPKLGVLGDNGGPTATQLPAVDSPVIDVGANPLTLTTDQRGFARDTDQPVGPDPTTTHTDIGAVELRAVVPDTTIDSGPPATNAPTDVSFAFSSTTSDVNFECSLDGGAFASCTSPKTYTGLADGEHSFRVRAVADGTPDPTPASATFSVTGATPPANPPNTSISKAKKKVKTKKPKAKVKVAFKSSQPGSTFECKVDKGAFKPCKSPLELKLKGKPGKGLKHTIEVRAVNASGQVDPTPAKTTIKVIRKSGKAGKQ